MPAECFACSCFALSQKIDWGCVKIVDAFFDGVVDKFIDLFLVYYVLALFVLFHRPSHTAVSEDADLVAACRVGAVGHIAVFGCIVRS
jgi:hypothetical protein